MVTEKGKNYLLVIAIDKYDELPQLTNCVKDSKEIIDELISRYTFEEKYTRFLDNNLAVKGEIFKELDLLQNTLTENDDLLIYFAGHGAYDEKSRVGYLIQKDAKKGEYWNYISHSDFRNKVKAIPSRHTLLILDSCFSGALLMNSRAIIPRFEDKYNFEKRVNSIPSHWCFAAGGIEEIDDGLHGENSPFAKEILNYLKSNEELCFSISSLTQYVKKEVANYSKQTPIEGTFSREKKGGGQFVLYPTKIE